MGAIQPGEEGYHPAGATYLMFQRPLIYEDGADPALVTNLEKGQEYNVIFAFGEGAPAYHGQNKVRRPQIGPFLARDSGASSFPPFHSIRGRDSQGLRLTRRTPGNRRGRDVLLKGARASGGEGGVESRRRR